MTDSGTPAQSRDEQFTITVTDVNDPPSFTLPADPDQTALEDAGAQTVPGFATAISAGGELGQTLTLHPHRRFARTVLGPAGNRRGDRRPDLHHRR